MIGAKVSRLPRCDNLLVQRDWDLAWQDLAQFWASNGWDNFGPPQQSFGPPQEDSNFEAPHGGGGNSFLAQQCGNSLAEQQWRNFDTMQQQWGDNEAMHGWYYFGPPQEWRNICESQYWGNPGTAPDAYNSFCHQWNQPASAPGEITIPFYVEIVIMCSVICY